MNAPCGENKSKDNTQEEDALSNVLEAMGMDQKCVQAARSSASTFTAAASASFGASGPLGLGNISGSAAN